MSEVYYLRCNQKVNTMADSVKLDKSRSINFPPTFAKIVGFILVPFRAQQFCFFLTKFFSMAALLRSREGRCLRSGK